MRRHRSPSSCAHADEGYRRRDDRWIPRDHGFRRVPRQVAPSRSNERCHELVSALAGHAEQIRARGARLVIVGNGSMEQAQRFFAEKGLPVAGVVVATDPSRESYRAAELDRGVVKTFFGNIDQRSKRRRAGRGGDQPETTTRPYGGATAFPFRSMTSTTRTFVRATTAHGRGDDHVDEGAVRALVALSCKGRGFCMRCGSRRMTETARHWVTRVLPHVRVRLWTLSFPFDLRRRLAFHHDEVLAVRRVVTRAIAARYLSARRAPSA